ncbi:MAG: hypothetical protein PT942_07610 [Eubacteriales bacterium]|nr:hypothetical protein [Eubacteriales bacterium]
MADLKIGADEMSAVKVVVKSFIDAYEDGSIEIENDTKELSNREFIGLVMSAYMKISYSLSLCETEYKKGE